MPWLLLIYTVPSTPSRMRAAVWRELKKAGAGYLRDGVAVLPDRTTTRGAFRAIAEQLRAFSDGATAAATAAIAGAVVVLAQRAIVDVPTALIALVSLGVLWRFRIPEPVVVLVAGAIGLVSWTVLR